jgi:NhaP-type Na+/H+ or K+/H+ antiporter
MDLSPAEYGAYWRASIRVAAGVLVGFFGVRLTSPLRTHPEVGASALGVVLLVALAFVGSFVAMLGVARVVRTAVDAET